MNNKEQYKKAFSILQTSCDITLEDWEMTKLRKKAVLRSIAVAAAAIILITGGSVTAYAKNAFGIQRAIQVWMHGDQTDVTINFDGQGNYEMKYTDKDGNEQESGGGGIAIEPDGTERPLTEEELMDDIMNDDIDVELEDDGRVYVYYRDQVVDITDKFDDKGFCHVLLQGDDGDLYLTVDKDETGVGFATNPDRYPEYREIAPGEYAVY